MMNFDATELSQIKAVYDDGFAEINDREYHFSKFRHNQRMTVREYIGTHQDKLKRGALAYGSKEYKEVEKIMMDNMIHQGMQLSKLPDHWENYPEDFDMVFATFIKVAIYPFMRGSNTDSTSRDDQLPKTTSKKPM